MSACVSNDRKELSEAEFLSRKTAALEDTLEVVRAANDRLSERIAAKPASAPDDARPMINVLAMSGGGDWGAFGSGVLVGWGKIADPAKRRPDFDMVTGVSTGSLLAPFAYIGTDEAVKTVDDFYRNPQQNWVQSRGLLFFLPSNPSFMVISNLEKAIHSAVDKSLVDAMAEQWRKGKLMLVSATDVDLGRQQFWEMGQLADEAARTGKPELVHNRLLASSAIPAAFPPVEIDGSLYVDGGVTANVLLRLDPESPEGFLQTWKRNYPDRPLPRVRYWIIVNNQRSQTPATVQKSWSRVLGPSLSTAIRSATFAEIRWLGAEAAYVNAVYNTDIEVRVLAIPDEWKPVVKGDFKKENMESLSDLGRSMGENPDSWTLLVSPGTRNMKFK